MVGAIVATGASAILLAILVEDLRRYRIRNAGVVLLLGCFAVDAAFGSRTGAVLPHLLLASFGAFILIGAFSLRLIGGGDAKLLVALLWVGPAGAVPFSLALVATTLAYAAGATLGLLPSRRAGGRLQIPFGPSIALAWLGVIGLSLT